MKRHRSVALLTAAWSMCWAADRPHIVFSRLAPDHTELFVADADGKNERALLPPGVDYNASFSSAGNWIIFTSERGGSADIYRMHADGSGIEQLTEGPSYDDQAALSPDGRTLAFVSTRETGRANVWLLDIARHEYTNLTQNPGGNFRPSWSPDGQWIAFSSGRDTKPGRAAPSWELLQSIAIYIVHPDGSGLRRLTELGGYAGSPQWSRDGKRIVCYQSTPGEVYPKRLRGTATSQIISIDVATGVAQTLTKGPGVKVAPRYADGDDVGYIAMFGKEKGLRFTSGRTAAAIEPRYPSWSADGKTMLSHRNLKADLAVTPAFGLDASMDLFSTKGWMMDYSPDGRQLVMTSGGGSKGPLMVMNGDGTNAHTILESGGKVITFPSWSPDGKSIVFGIGAFFDRPPKPGQIGLIQPDGSGLRMLTEGKTSSGFASWSPDGKQLVYRVLGDGQMGLRILTLADGKVTTLSTEWDSFPMWQPHGDRILFCSSRDGDFNLYTMRADGSEVRKLTDSHGNDAHAIWSPDGKWILFSSSRKGFKDEAMLDEWGPQPYGDLYVMRADGSEVRQLTDNQFEEATPAWRP